MGLGPRSGSDQRAGEGIDEEAPLTASTREPEGCAIGTRFARKKTL